MTKNPRKYIFNNRVKFMPKIGTVTHFYNKIGVAVVAPDKGSLSVGDRVRFKHGTHEFDQTVESLQIDQQPVSMVKKGEEAGLKVDQPVKEGWEVYKE